MTDRLITVAIHTYEKAVMLKSLLESEGVSVTLQNVNLVQPVVSSGVRVRIHETDLPLALRVIENTDIFCHPSPDAGGAHNGHLVIIPTDGSVESTGAICEGFRLAAIHSARVMLLHAYLTPKSGMGGALTNSLTFNNDLLEAEQSISSEKTAEATMKRVDERIKNKIKNGEIPAVRYDVRLEEGIPEEVINQVSRREKPLMIVMGTRGASQKEREMMGSVAAEVLDTSRQAIITVPARDMKPLKSGTEINTVYFGNLDQADMLALDSLYRLFDKVKMHVTLVHIPPKKAPANREELARQRDALLSWCCRNYERFTFDWADVALPTISEDVRKIIDERGIDLLAMPNKKRNVFARFFNPTLPHRLLYAANLPMAVIPV